MKFPDKNKFAGTGLYGVFVWLVMNLVVVPLTIPDPENNKIELWEPVDSEFKKMASAITK